MSGVYDLTEAVTKALPNFFVMIEEHEGEDVESPDLLWIERTEGDTMSEGKVLLIEPSTEGPDRWLAVLQSACRFYRWPVYWSMSGTADELVREIEKVLPAALATACTEAEPEERA